ncbi:hypothetical protein C5F49_05160 [Nitrosopumilus oxyclinae]|uniref:Uncharacterized protein n=1 Tax=Nitrosopumilus oxyclinae TaxID=1959104 RepID=A0A7D5M6H3_9ARCH|nr:hypothetical protein [Nitrosopumilus oxyclinae]QLH04769.1 hypothetical protein C5F49_05160 [Nitrosopumilus oxyclinae]
MTDEYAELQKLRALWSKAIIQRDYIFIPLVLGIVSVSLSQLPNFPPEWRFVFLVFEGILLTFAMAYWRYLTRMTDKGIVGLYGRMMELEKKDGMDTQTQYYYRYLKDEHRGKINKEVGLEKDNVNFSKFREMSTKIKEGYHYDLLLGIWNDLEFNSVKPRGHEIHNAFAISLIVAYWVTFAIFGLAFPDAVLIETVNP